MLPSPSPSTHDISFAQNLRFTNPPDTSPKGHLEPHVDNLPRRRRLTQLPTPDSETSDEVPEPLPLRPVVSTSSPIPHSFVSTATSSCPLPTSPSRRPALKHSKHIRDMHYHYPPPIEVIPGSGVYAFRPPSNIEDDDTGVPPADFSGDSRAAVLGKAMFQLCMKEPWRKGLVEGVYMRLHDLGMVPEPWTGALRREGLAVVDGQLRRQQERTA